MGLFDFFRKQRKSIPDYDEKFIVGNVPVEINNQIDNVDWRKYETAYGNAEPTIPINLKHLFGDDKRIAMNAAHQLWSSLCHQHAYISSASLPSYEILKIGLLQLDDELKIELLDIFLGFSVCTSDKYFTACKQTPSDWEEKLKQKLILDIDLFKELTKHTNEDISDFACEIVDDLTNQE